MLSNMQKYRKIT